VRPLALVLRVALLGSLASCASSSFSAQRPPREPLGASKLELYLGGRSFDHDDWHPVEDQGMVGLEFVHEGRDAPVGFEVAVFASEDDEHAFHIPSGHTVELRGETEEFSIGLRKTFSLEEGPVHPYVGGGLSGIHAEFKGVTASGSSTTDEDGSAGLYLHTGIDFDLGPNFLMGFNLRFLTLTDIRLFGVSGTADYAQFAIVFGFRF
jgi:opacity protein-like surface antigen